MATTTAHGTAPLPIDQAIGTARQAAEARGFVLNPAESSPTQLVFKKGITMTSWGARLTLDFQQTGPATTQVGITAKETWALTDWGRGKKTSAAILAALGAA